MSSWFDDWMRENPDDSDQSSNTSAPTNSIPSPRDDYDRYLQDFDAAPDAASKIAVGDAYATALHNGTPYTPMFPGRAALQSISNAGDSVAAGLRAIPQGATAGLSKYFDAAQLYGLSDPNNGGQPINWNHALDLVQAQNDQDKAQHPIAYYGGNIVGGIGAAALTGGGSLGVNALTRAGLPLAGSQMVRAGIAGATLGGVGGFTANRGMDDAVSDTSQGALLGGTLGGVLSGAGSLIKSSIQTKAGQMIAGQINDLLANKPAGWNQKINDILSTFSKVKPDTPNPVSPMGPDVLGMANDMSEMSPALRTPTNLNAAAQRNGFQDFNDYADNGAHDDVISMAQAIPSSVKKTLVQDNQGNPLQLSISHTPPPFYRENSPADILVEAHNPMTGERQGFANFSQGEDGTLVPSLVRVSPDFRRRGIATQMYQQARDAGYNIQPGKVQTTAGAGMSQALSEKGIVNKPASGPIFFAGSNDFDIASYPSIQGPIKMNEEQALAHIQRETSPPAPNRAVLESEMQSVHKQMMDDYINNLLNNTANNFDTPATQAANRSTGSILNSGSVPLGVNLATRMSPGIVPNVVNSSTIPALDRNIQGQKDGGKVKWIVKKGKIARH